MTDEAASKPGPRIKPSHQHEGWQIRESASGGHFCAACGESVQDDRLPLPDGCVGGHSPDLASCELGAEWP